MFQRQWLVIGGVLAAAVIVSMVWGKAKVTAQTPTLSFKPTQGRGGGVVSNVSDASSGLPAGGKGFGGAGDEAVFHQVDDDNFFPD